MTPRPCKEKHHTPADFVGECHFCRLAVTNPAYRSWASPAASSAKPAACPHRGEPTGERHECATCGGRVSIPVLSCAVHGTCTFARKVDGVACCDGCPDDPTAAAPAAAPPPDPWANRVECPRAPALDLKAERKTAVVTLAFGNKGRAESAVSRPLMERFARRVGADFRVLEWPGVPEYVFSSKWAIGRAAEQYDRILYLDADVIPRPGCVNPFDFCRPEAFGAVDELAFLKAVPHFGREPEYRRFLADRGLPDSFPVPWAVNAGVMVIPNRLSWVFEAPAYPVPPYHCAEQDTTNYRILLAAMAGGAEYQLLDRRCNWQWWTDHEFRSAPPDAVLHFSATGANRIPLMRAWAARAGGA